MLGSTVRQTPLSVTERPDADTSLAKPALVSRPQLFVLLAAYFAAHAVLRGLVSEVAGIDDVDQVLRAQLWSWGYGPQPPLYTWLTKIFLGTFGFNTFSLALLKETLVFTIFASVYGSAWQLTHNHRWAVAATALLELLPSIAWEAHRELTHTVLASALVTATVYSFLRLDPNRSKGYVLFGICGGLGLLAKYNFAIVYLALLLAACGVPQTRRIVVNPRILLAFLIALAICGPHLNWVWNHRDLALSSVHKLKIVQTSPWWAAGATGLSKFGLVIVAHTGLLLVFVAVMFQRDLSRFRSLAPGAKVLWHMMVWIIGLVSLGLVIFRVTGPRDRYVQPLFVCLPILLISPLRECLSRARLAVILALSASTAAVILVVCPVRVLLTERLQKHEVLTMPMYQLAGDLKPLAEQADCIIAQDHPLAGNLRLRFPGKLVIDPEVGALFSPTAAKTLVVWNAGNSPAQRAELARFVREFTGRTIMPTAASFEERLKYHHQRTIRLAAAFVQ